MRRLLATSLAVVLIAAACSSSGDPDGSSVSAAQAAEETTADSGTNDEPATPTDSEGTTSDAASVSVPELDFVASTVDGAELNGADYVGTDTVFWFWAPW